MKKACQLISKLGFDGIDINMGCPDKSVVRQGAGSALTRTPALAREIIRSAIAGASRLAIFVEPSQVLQLAWLQSIKEIRTVNA
jgi:tRNA-dihydrouridine synthase